VASPQDEIFTLLCFICDLFSLFFPFFLFVYLLFVNSFYFFFHLQVCHMLQFNLFSMVTFSLYFTLISSSWTIPSFSFFCSFLLFLFSHIIAPCSCSCFFIFLFHVLAPIHLLGPNLFPKTIISCLIHYIFIVHVAM